MRAVGVAGEATSGGNDGNGLTGELYPRCGVVKPMGFCVGVHYQRLDTNFPMQLEPVSALNES